jgi:hypothetical protein
MDQYQLYFIVALLEIILLPGKLKLILLPVYRNSFFFIAASIISCQVYPSEYAYHDDSVMRNEIANANCRMYPPSQERHIHCNGKPLKLTDNNLGQEQYQSSEYYQWTTRNTAQLLFIFPTRVSLTTITLHYYSDRDQGLPELILYAVPDDFDIWNAPIASYPDAVVASVQPGEPAGHRNVSLNINFNTMKVLMYKSSSNFKFAVSEVEFFICSKYELIINSI